MINLIIAGEMGTCNVTALGALFQMTSHLFYDIKLSLSCQCYMFNVVLNAPRLLAKAHPPALLGKLRFMLLAHLLCCNSLQLLLLTAEAVLLAAQLGMPVAQCLVFSTASQACCLMDMLLSAALAVDRCVAIKWPLHYELLLSGHYRMQVDVLPRCRVQLMVLCLSQASGLWIFSVTVSVLVLPACYLTALGCFLLLWRDTRGLLYSHHAQLTLAMQAIQMLFYSVPVLLNSYLLHNSLHCDALDIAASAIYNLDVLLIPLVYGYHSRELQKRLLQAMLGNQVHPDQ
ncbi:olfactory receptor 5C1-like [Arapaima gigas]